MRSDSDLGSTSTLPLSGSAAASVDPRIGQVLAKRYRILGRIGRGGMGSIYEAEHVLTSKRFAIKTLLPGLDRVGEIARRFEREARASSVMNHPNVVSVSDFGALEDGSLYLAMELVRGRPLGDLIDDGAVAPERSYVIVRQVLEALSHAHGLGIIHRDLKPDNVMVLDDAPGEDPDRVKLLDFGIAKVVGETEAKLGGEALTQAGIAFGTPDYMAPEQALGEPVDARADLYAIGVILFELLAGRKPFVNEDKMAVLRMQVALDPPRLSEAAAGRPIAAELDVVVARSLAKRRTDRYVDAEDMIRALDAAWVVQRALLVAAPPPPMPPAPPEPIPDAAPPLAPPREERTNDVVPAVAVGSAVTAPPPSSVGLGLPPWLTPRLLAIGGGVLVLLVIMIAIAASSGGRAPRRSGGAVIVPPGGGGPPQPKTERAKAAEKLLERGQAAQVVATLDAATATPEGARDAWAHLVLGHARVETDKLLEGLAAYDRAISLEPTLGDDRRLRENAEKLLGKKDKRIAVAAMDLIGRVGVLGHPTILEQASHGKVKEVRRRARELAEEKGIDGDVDWVSSWSLDLEQGQSCKERREAIPKLRALRDERAIPALKKARGRSGGFLGLESINGCLDKDAKEAIEFLEAL